MLRLKYIFIIIILFLILTSVTYAQESNSEITVDYTHVCFDLEYMIIEATATENNEEAKLLSIEYMRDALKGGRFFAKDLFDIVKYLAFEGTVNPPERLMYKNSNFPKVRNEAVKLIGELCTEEAKAALIEVLKHENNAAVLHETIKTLFLHWSDIYDNKDEIDVIINTIKKLGFE